MGVIQSRISSGLKKIKLHFTGRNRLITQSISQPSVNIQSLPQELLLHVFSFLSPTELCESVSKVCAHWNSLHRDPLLYCVLVFRDGEISTETIIKFLKLAPWLKSLTLINRRDIKKILEQVCESNKHLRILILQKIDGSLRISASTMKKIIQKCPQLRTLKLHGCYVRGDVFYKTLSLQLPRLRTVHFVHGRKFSSEAVLHLVNSCLDLEDIRVYNNYSAMGNYMEISNTEIMALCDRFHKTLRSMKLDFGVWSVEAFASLKKCRRLEDLGIFEAHSMSCEGLLAIGTMSSLRHLEITCCSVPEDAWILMFTSTALKSLESLNLCRCNITDDVAITISAHLKNLTLLGLTGRQARHPQASNWVSSRGVKSVIKGCSKLKTLELLYMDSTVENTMLLIPKCLPGLTKLCIFQERNSDWDTVTQVKTQMPELVTEYINN